jgi:ABC-2 type transport system permease protein
VLNQIFALTLKDLKIFFKDRGAMILIFLQPLMFIIIMSLALSGLYRSGDIRLLAVNQDQGKQADGFLRQLGKITAFHIETTWEKQPLTLEKAQQLIVRGKRPLALIFPPDFSSVLEQDPVSPDRKTTKILVIVDPATSSQFVEPIMGTLQGLLEKTMFTATVPKGIDYVFDHILPQTTLEKREAFKARAEGAISGDLSGKKQPVVTVERTFPRGMFPQKSPDSFQQNVPAYTIYGVFWIVTLLAGSVLREKREGTFRRLLAAPISRAAMLAGKLAPYYIINLIQLVLMLGAARLFFGMSLGPSWIGLVVVSLVLAGTATGLGVLVASFVRSEAQAGSLTVLLLLSLSALGGCFIPRFVMPVWLRTAGLVTPHAWALDAYQDLIVRGYTFPDVLPKVGALGLFAVIFFVIGVWRFKFE